MRSLHLAIYIACSLGIAPTYANDQQQERDYFDDLYSLANDMITKFPEYAAYDKQVEELVAPKIQSFSDKCARKTKAASSLHAMFVVKEKGEYEFPVRPFSPFASCISNLVKAAFPRLPEAPHDTAIIPMAMQLDP